jgi:hypothetical protein
MFGFFWFFRGCWMVDLLDFLDSGLSDVWIFGVFLRTFGSGFDLDFLVFLRMVVGFFRMLFWIFDIGFGHLVFPDLVVVVC